jgi:hypothetical protein
MKHPIPCCLLLSLLVASIARAELTVSSTPAPGAVSVVANGRTADIYVDSNDIKLVNIAAGLLADDVERVSGQKPKIAHDPAQLGAQAIIVGSIGHSALIDQLAASGKIDVADVKDQWETFKVAVVNKPLPNVESAIIVAGSDRRGTAYGVFEISKAIGVSPWYWWADIPPQHRDAIVISPATIKEGPPSVKYRGIFINDEDWGLQPWSAKTFEPEVGDIGPKTYAKVFELLLRLRANYIWPAMHEVTKEFYLIPGNVETADEWGIVAGASHPEPMNRNNVHWNQENRGPWRYDTNREGILKYWEEAAQSRGKYEANWTIGMRGVHDSGMQGPSDMPSRLKLLEQAIADQRDLLKKYVNPDILKVPQIFTPYKEALQMYQAGLKVPEDVTIVWTEDNYGYIRQLSNPTEQKRSGDSGVYYHISYLGSPFSYVWINTTPPALIWEEMSKAYAYGADRVWVLNVGDIKPGEIGISYWMRLGWDINAYNRETTPNYLNDFFKPIFGESLAQEIAPMMDQYYRLGYARKPGSLHREPNIFGENYNEAYYRLADYGAVVKKAEEIAAKVPDNRKDAYFELVLYPVRMAALTNEVFICASLSQTLAKQNDPLANVYADRSKAAIERIDAETAYYNDELAGGKWKNIMTAKGTTARSWGFNWPTPATTAGNAAPAEAAKLKAAFATPDLPPRPAAKAAATFIEKDKVVAMEAEHPTRKIARGDAQWQIIPGLGRTGDTIAVFPVTVASVDPANVASQSPALEYDFTTTSSGETKITTYNLPTRRINDTRGLRYAIAIDDAAPQVVDYNIVNETDRRWSRNVMWNASVDSTTHTIAAPGKHTLKVWMVDPGVVMDKIVIDLGGAKESYLGPPETPAE